MWCFAGSANDMSYIPDTGGLMKKFEGIDPILLKNANKDLGYLNSSSRRDRHAYDQRGYKIKGVTFDQRLSPSIDDYYFEFEIVSDEDSENESLKAFSLGKKARECDERRKQNGNAEQAEAGDRDTPLVALMIQEVRKGVIVNSNVYLNELHWHTTLRVDEDTLQCAVCSVVYSADDYKAHINTAGHARNLRSHLPLDYYDLCIMRKIDRMYHCGVCNSFFHATELDEHLSAKSHEKCLLSAINKVSDISSEDQLGSPRSKNQVAANGGRLVEYDDDVLEGFYEYDPTQSNCDYWANDFTYASMARTPCKSPKHLEVDIGGRKAWVTKDAWHMIFYLKSKKYYCMICKKEGPNNKSADHCNEERHLSKLANCSVDSSYKHHLVRKLDAKYVHCAHCNNLQLTSDIDNHLELKHPVKRNKNLIDSQSGDVQQKSNNTHPAHTAWNGQKNGEQARPPSASGRHDPIASRMVELNIFSNKLIVPLLNYNMVLVSDVCHCVICEVTFYPEALSKHFEDQKHVHRLKGVHFISGFACHLIRTINNGLHCAICNALVTHTLIQSHIRNPGHTSLLKRAMATTAGSLSQLTPQCEPTNQFSILNEISDSPEPASRKASPVSKNASPVSKNASLVSKNASPVSKNASPVSKNASPVSKNASLVSKNASPVSKNASPATDNNQLERTSFDIEAFVNVRLGNVVLKISACSYNTLVSYGDGARECFLCSKTVPIDRIAHHVQRREHQENLERNKFLEKSTKSLLRQIYVTYHCGVCNVLVRKRDLERHLNWPVHIQHVQLAITTKRERKKRLTLYDVTQQYEILYTNPADPQIKIRQCLRFSGRVGEVDAQKKSKIVIINSEVAKIDWHAWNGFKHVIYDGFVCLLCQITVKKAYLVQHSKKPEHLNGIEGFLQQYLPGLVRTTNGVMLNCVTCNVVFRKDVSSINEHINSEAHNRSYEEIMKNSAKADLSGCCEIAFSLGTEE